jgi:RNA polymerase sigma-70 factor (ECF subfamily)
MDKYAASTPNPEQQASISEVRRLLEKAVEELPDSYPTVFLLRERGRDEHDRNRGGARDQRRKCQGSPAPGARALLRRNLYARACMETKSALHFHASRCDRVVKNVFERIQTSIMRTETQGHVQI